MKKLKVKCILDTTIQGIHVGEIYNVEHETDRQYGIDYKIIYNETETTFESVVGNKDWFNKHFMVLDN